nr:MAG TPA: hypothetical protein [Caudoviricetes sp.]
MLFLHSLDQAHQEQIYKPCPAPCCMAIHLHSSSPAICLYTLLYPLIRGFYILRG